MVDRTERVGWPTGGPLEGPLLAVGASLGDMQDHAGHKDPRINLSLTAPVTTWTATPPYTVAAYLA